LDEEYCEECGEVVKVERVLCPNCGTRKHPEDEEDKPERIVLRGMEKDRPIAGGLLLVFAGILLMYIPFQTLNSFAFTGGTAELIGLIGLAFGAIVFLSGAGAVAFPKLTNLLGILGILASLLSAISGTFGGMGVGTVLGTLGGLVCVFWKPTEPELSIRKPVAVTLSVGGIPFVLAVLYWLPTAELLAFWLAVFVSAPFFLIGAVVGLLTYS